MREIILDTETTGFGAEANRVLEIGCVELINKIPTGKVFHHYLNPERVIDPGSIKIHGITDDKVKDAPLFKSIAEAFLAFMADSPLVAHNADFDVSFLNAELARAGHPPLTNPVIDTLAIAKQKLPGQRHNLDALCRHFNVDNTARTTHGALLDAQLLANVYVELTGGLQGNMELTATVVETVTITTVSVAAPASPIVMATAEETEAHKAFLAKYVPTHTWPPTGQS
jgi:DNA polymerase-3 subunit epsilon